ncbi:MAG: ABC transporter permease DevC [Acetobacteraceae bacterium]|nr:ABC transporter permease DevC [Acetobacteraceae bacterium]
MPRGPALPVAAHLATRLAWRMLRHDPARLGAALAGVAVAALLVLMQLGFQASLLDTAVRLLASFRGDLFLIHPTTTATFRPEPFPRARGWQALAEPEVLRATPIAIGMLTWRDPTHTGEGWERRRMIQVIGLDLDQGAADWPGLGPIVHLLRAPDTLAFDAASTEVYGDVTTRLAAEGPFEAQLGPRAMRVVGTIRLGASFGADGNVVMSFENFRRVVPRAPALADLVSLELQPGADARAVQARLRALLPRDVEVLTAAELVLRERRFWEAESPIGVIFGFGAATGLVVGLVVVYQILFSAVAAHIPEFATLRAIGYGMPRLLLVVMGAALLLAALGYVPGFAGAVWMYGLVGDAMGIPMIHTAERAMMVFALVFGMCGASGAMAAAKLRQADPAALL